MQIVMSVKVPGGSQFLLKWDGPVLPIGADVYPFVDDDWLVSFSVIAVTATVRKGEVLIEAESDETEIDMVDEMECDLRQGGWLTCPEFYADDPDSPYDKVVLDDPPSRRLQLTFKTAGMPADMFSQLYEQEYVVPDGVGKYIVGGFVTEAEEADESDKASYPPEDVEKSRRIDNYFIAGGAVKGQTIFIEHG